jgi:hypothetical protein
MRIHTSATYAEVRAALPQGVFAYITEHKSRKRDRAFEVTLFVTQKDELHRRYGNSGGYGRSDDVAATWDEWGLWMVGVYEADPEAIIGWYETEHDFYDITRRERDRVRAFNKPTSIMCRTRTAPWLD